MNESSENLVSSGNQILISEINTYRQTKQKAGVCSLKGKSKKYIRIMNLLIIIRIIFVTTQISYFSESRHKFIRFLQQSDESLDHIFATSASAIFSKDSLNSYLRDTYKNYNDLPQTSLLDLILPENPFPYICHEEANGINKTCVKIITINDLDRVIENIFKKLEKINLITIDVEVRVSFINRDNYSANPKCFSNHYIISLENSADGQSFSLSGESNFNQIDCPSSKNSNQNEKISKNLIFNILTLIFCITAEIMSLISIYNDTRRCVNNFRLFKKYTNQNLNFIEILWFYHLWSIFDIFTNMFIIIGTVINLSIDNLTRFNSDLCSVFLGIGTILTWILFIRILDSNAQYHILLSTLKRAAPDVARYLTCVSIIFMGFMLCGWVILGPYHPKFSTSEKTAQTLFATLNGDDIYLTFELLSTSNMAIYIVGQIYIYSSVFFFMYIALSMLISIFTLSYNNEPLKHRCPESLLEKIQAMESIFKNLNLNGDIISQ